MNPIEAVRSCFKQYAGFSGRARRSEYWWFTLFTSVVSGFGGVLDRALHLSFPWATDDAVGSTGPIQSVVAVVVVLPLIAVSIRRMHDIGRSGWWMLIELVPCIGWIWWIVLAVQDSGPDNQYGPNPKRPPAPPAPPPYGYVPR